METSVIAGWLSKWQRTCDTCRPAAEKVNIEDGCHLGH